MESDKNWKTSSSTKSITSEFTESYLIRPKFIKIRFNPRRIHTFRPITYVPPRSVQSANWIILSYRTASAFSLVIMTKIYVKQAQYKYNRVDMLGWI